MMREDAKKIYTGAIRASLPDAAVKEALRSFSTPCGRLVLIAIGKAAWQMARSAIDCLAEMGIAPDVGVVITKYGHSMGDIPGIEIYEAAHPIPDENGVLATERALSLTGGLTEKDVVLFLISGGGSALFESPFCTLAELSDLTRRLLASGADINEINAVRKHISKVKGGRFAEHVYPAKIFAIALSDVIGNRLDTIASGPAAPDKSTSCEVFEIIKKYKIEISDSIRDALMKETPKAVENAVHHVGGSVSELCRAAKRIAESLGYEGHILRDDECGIAREVGESLAKLAALKSDTDTPISLIIGGETVVKLHGDGLGGRNQELALSAAKIISGKENIAVFSVGSDGTDGPTDAAGGYVDGESYEKMLSVGVDYEKYLENNDSYHALKSIDSLIITGPTGTNVNDVSVALIGRKRS